MSCLSFALRPYYFLCITWIEFYGQRMAIGHEPFRAGLGEENLSLEDKRTQGYGALRRIMIAERLDLIRLLFPERTATAAAQ